MPSTIVLNADLDVCPAMGTWITNNTQLLSGFSLLIAEDVIEELLGKLSLEANTEKKEDVKKSPMLDALSKGEAVVDGQQRKVVKGARKTAQGKQMQPEAEP